MSTPIATPGFEAVRLGGNIGAEIKAYLATGIDGFFTDNVADGVAASR